MKTNLFISYSGGKTSGYMTKKIIENYTNQYNIVVVFANTGQEREETLDFVNKSDIEWGLNVVWVEAKVFHTERYSSGHIIVDYDTASRNGQPFEEVIRKYGIPNQTWPHCTRELKLNPMLSYIKSIGWGKGEYQTAIGIRFDETRRVNKKAEELGIVYPLIDWFMTDKQDVNDWWEDQSFNLQLEEHQGNCSWCWKKSMRKHCLLINENPEIFHFTRRMEELYAYSGFNDDGKKRVFFRNHMSTADLFEYARELYDQEARQGCFDLDINSGCSESCEVYSGV